METKDKEEMKEFILQAIQAGKAETSGLVGHIMEKLDGSIEIAVQKHVNGKIIRMSEKLDTYIKEDTEWKKKYEPYIEGLANVSGSAKIIVGIAVLISAVIGAFLSIKGLFK